MKNRKLIILLVLAVILLGAAVLRLYNLEEESLWLDECFTLDYSSKPIPSLIETLKKDVHPIGYYLPQHLLLDYFGSSEISLRILSVFFGVLSVYLTYLLGKKFFSWKEGLLAAFFMAMSYTAILYSQDAKMYSMFGAFFLLSLLAFIRFLEKPSWLNTVFFSLSSALLLYTHIIGLVIFGGYFCFYVTGYLLKHNAGIGSSFSYKTLFSSKIFLVLLIVFLWYWPWFTMLVLYQLPRLYISLGEKFIEKTGLNLLPVVVASMIFLVLLYVIILYLMVKGKINVDNIQKRFGSSTFLANEKALFLLLLLFLAFDLLVSRYLFSSVPIVRFVFFLLPMGQILLSRILLRMKSTHFATILFVLFMISASFELYKYYQVDSKEQFREAAKYVENHASAADILFLHRATIAKLCFDYYYSGNVEEIRLITSGEDDYLLMERAAGKRDAYLVLTHNYHTKDYFKRKMDALYELVEEKKFIGITIYKYRISDAYSRTSES